MVCGERNERYEPGRNEEAPERRIGMDDKQRKRMIHEVVKETDPKKRDEKYNQYVSQVTPKHNPWINIIWAFAVGGAICTLGQALLNLYQNLGASKEDAALYETVTLIFLSALFTGLNLYQKLTKYAGAGSVVPITGFANSVAASAIEYSKDKSSIISTSQRSIGKLKCFG